MRTTIAVFLAAGLAIVAGCSSSSDLFTSPSSIGGADATAAKGGNGGGGGGNGGGGNGGGGDAIAVRGMWGPAPVGQETAISGGDFDGEILGQLGLHAEGDDLGDISVTGIGGHSTGGTLVLVHMNGVGILTTGLNEDAGMNDVEADGFAHGFVVEWTDAIDANITYRLHYGDPNTQPEFNYGHVVCTDGSVDGSSPCAAAVIDSKIGIYDSTAAVGTATPRATGPRASLRRQVGKRKAVVIGYFDVPFSLNVQ